MLERKYKVFFISVLLVISYLIGTGVSSYRFSKFTPDVKRDTTYIYDTLEIDKPTPVQSKIIGSRIPVLLFCDGEAKADTVVVKDTTYIYLKREQKYYKNETFEAWISGYEPSLDKLNIFNTTKTITNTIQPKKNYLEASISAEIGKHLTTPISVQYTRNYKYLSLGAGLSYEPIYKDVSVFVEASVPLWSW